MAPEDPYAENVRYAEACLEKHGDTHEGMGWTKSPESAVSRQDVMLDVIRDGATAPICLLDFGCGTSQLLDRIRARGLDRIDYVGLDASERMLDVARRKFPDVQYLTSDQTLDEYDYVVASGVFTMRLGLSAAAAWEHARGLTERLFSVTRVGLAANFTSSHVDWERDDLLHVPVDDLLAFATERLTRHVVIRHDYPLYEYTAYVYREPATARSSA